MYPEVNLKSLQNALAHIDDTYKPRQHHPTGALDLSVLATQKLKLKIYKELNHNKPHIHVEYGSDTHKASVSIETGEILAGNLDRKYKKAIKNWVLSNSDALNNIWSALRKDKSTEAFEKMLSGTFSI